MADNYIERQRELYEARKAAWSNQPKHKVRKTGTTSTEESVASRNASGNEQVNASCGRKEAASCDRKSRKVFVTGGAMGIGKGIVTMFCQNGDQVAFCDVNQRAGESTARETGATFYPVDVTCVPDLEACFTQCLQEWGNIDILINNVGISLFESITETSVETFDRILQTNLRPVFVLSRLLAIHRKEQAAAHPEYNDYGRIINLCSTRYLMSEPGSEGYAASKGGIYSLTHALALSLSEWNITVNSIAPGWIQNNRYTRLTPEDHLQHPSKRVGKPEDIARMCLFLCQPENDFINGENITMDGGMTKKMIYVE